MLHRNHISNVLIIGVAVLCCGVFCAVRALPQPDKTVGKATLVVRCGPHFGQATERVFANPGLSGWKEYTDAKEVPPLARDTGEQIFIVSFSPSGRRYGRSLEF